MQMLARIWAAIRAKLKDRPARERMSRTQMLRLIINLRPGQLVVIPDSHFKAFNDLAFKYRRRYGLAILSREPTRS